MTTIEKQALQVLNALLEDEARSTDPTTLSRVTNLSRSDLSDAVDYLEDQGALEVLRELGNPSFVEVIPKARARFLYELMREVTDDTNAGTQQLLLERPLNPVGSPYGFTDEDWELIALRRKDKPTLYVVFGYQFESPSYETSRLIDNIKAHFMRSVATYNAQHPGNEIHLEFSTLAAGYGDHIFNQIARDIIGADIAIFDTSDLNPNVMIELGVALTWGVRILPIRDQSAADLPSDLSGQTWIRYQNSGSKMLDERFDEKLMQMIVRAVQKKGRQ